MHKITLLALAAIMTATSVQAADGGPRRTNATEPASTGKLKNPSKPQKGVIFIDGKRLTVCADWGKDKGWCKKHAN